MYATEFLVFTRFIPKFLSLFYALVLFLIRAKEVKILAQ